MNGLNLWYHTQGKECLFHLWKSLGELKGLGKMGKLAKWQKLDWTEFSTYLGWEVGILDIFSSFGDCGFLVTLQSLLFLSLCWGEVRSPGISGPGHLDTIPALALEEPESLRHFCIWARTRVCLQVTGSSGFHLPSSLRIWSLSFQVSNSQGTSG